MSIQWSSPIEVWNCTVYYKALNAEHDGTAVYKRAGRSEFEVVIARREPIKFSSPSLQDAFDFAEAQLMAERLLR